ncbi:N-formylglutamate amidohydrolase [Bradyrhizobium sp. AZCC 1699]|uniref:N-formylglutamate amidohydrolase n=1 Tax=Bradyrhizobium sp. AZCC 1699 TaxID=3117024 RepID=UPI002FEEC85F
MDQNSEPNSGSAAGQISVLHIPHSSRSIPADERARLAISDTELEAELLRMTDAFTAEIFPPTIYEARRIVFPVSRLVCDVERFADDAEESMSARGMGAVYTATSTESQLRPPLSSAERERIMTRWYRPHHELLTLAVDHVLASEGRCLIVDCHSFSSKPLPHEPDQDLHRPDICIGTDPFHTPPDLVTAVVKAANDLGLAVVVDRPFAGALAPAKHYQRDGRVKSVMIEVNRRLYMDERTGERIANFDRAAQAATNMLSAAAALLLES